MKIDALLARHPWPWTVETPICLGPRRIVDKDCWPVFEIVPGNKTRDFDVLDAIHSLVEAHVKAAAKLRAEALLGAESKEAKPQAPACKTCNDTHQMWLESKELYVPCTKCPMPCYGCRVGAYCGEVPCKCSCHKATER